MIAAEPVIAGTTTIGAIGKVAGVEVVAVTIGAAIPTGARRHGGLMIATTGIAQAGRTDARIGTTATVPAGRMAVPTAMIAIVPAGRMAAQTARIVRGSLAPVLNARIGIARGSLVPVRIARIATVPVAGRAMIVVAGGIAVVRVPNGHGRKPARHGLPARVRGKRGQPVRRRSNRHAGISRVFAAAMAADVGRAVVPARASANRLKADI